MREVSKTVVHFRLLATESTDTPKRPREKELSHVHGKSKEPTCCNEKEGKQHTG